jgi:hypothetical protein
MKAKRLELEFRPDEMKALVPWREWYLTMPQIVAGAAGMAAVIVLALLLDVAEDGPAYIFAAVVAAALFLGVVIGAVHSMRNSPVAMDREGISAPTLWGQKYVPWSNVHTVAHVHAMLGWSRAPIEFNLILFLRRGVPRRISLPDLSADERELLFEVLRRIARLHQIGFVADHTEDGRRALKRLPWLWF